MVGQQRLRDAGYGDEVMQGEEEPEKELEKDEEVDLEVALAPWTITKNFVLAQRVRIQPVSPQCSAQLLQDWKQSPEFRQLGYERVGPTMGYLCGLDSEFLLFRAKG